VSIEDAANESRHTDAERALALLQLRSTPQFFIADPHSAITYCSSELIGTPLLARSKRVFEIVLERGGPIDNLTFERLDANSMLRVVPLIGGNADCYAVFIEPVKSRNSVEAAIKRYDVSPREAEVLELLVAGMTTPQIANRLSISEGTVGDHVKSLFRKTRTNKRSELVGRIFRWEGDAGHARSPVPSRRATVTRTYEG
jgi:DNA-binding CsgD family transcriptional regulator